MKMWQRQIVRQILCIFALLPCQILLAQPDRHSDSDNLVLHNWKLALGAAPIGIPQAEAGSVAIICDDNSLKMVSKAGKGLWSTHFKKKLLPYISRNNTGNLYFGSEDGELIALNRAGLLTWRIKGRKALSGAPLIGWDGRLFIPRHTELEARSPSGRLLWRQSFSQGIDALCIDNSNGGLFVASKKNLSLLDPYGGQYLLPLSSNVQSLLSLNGPYQLKQSGLAALENGEIIFFNREESFSILKNRGTSHTIDMAFWEDVLFVLYRDGLLEAYKLDLDFPSDIKLLWTASTMANTTANGPSRLMVDERGLYCLGYSNAQAYAFDGRRLWHVRLSQANSATTFSDDGLVYSGGKDWVLYAYRTEERIKSEKDGFFGIEQGRNYGLAEIEEPDELARFFQRNTIYAQEQLKEIATKIEVSGPGSQERALSNFLLQIAMGKKTEASQQPNVPLQLKALEILSRFASIEILPILIDIYLAGPDPSVKAQVARNIGEMGLDPQGRALLCFESSLYKSDIHDEQLMMAIIFASGRISRFSGPPHSQRVINILTYISRISLSPLVRSEAEAQIKFFLGTEGKNRVY